MTTMADLLGAVLVGVVDGDGCWACDRVDSLLLDVQAYYRVVACVAPVPRWDYPVREVREPLLERSDWSH